MISSSEYILYDCYFTEEYLHYNSYTMINSDKAVDIESGFSKSARITVANGQVPLRYIKYSSAMR